MKPNIAVINKKHNHIVTKPALVPYCTQIHFLANRA